jgi:hypothetical protein
MNQERRSSVTEINFCLKEEAGAAKGVNHGRANKTEKQTIGRASAIKRTVKEEREREREEGKKQWKEEMRNG